MSDPVVLDEIIGTMILITLGGGVVAGVTLSGSKAQGSGWIVITAGWGLGVAMAIYAVGDISGGHINPAVTLGLASIGEFPWSSVPTYTAGQFIGAFLGAALVWLHYYPHWERTADAEAKRAVFCTDPAVRHTPSNLLSETIGTFMLVLGVLSIGANAFTESLNPLIVGLLVFSIGLSLGGTTGYAINPARDLGPRLAHFLLPIRGEGHSDWKYAWIPVAGPVLGGVAGAMFYHFVFLHGQPMAMATFLGAIVACLLISLAASSRVPTAKDRQRADP